MAQVRGTFCSEATLPVVLRPNGRAGHFETPSWLSWLSGIIAALIVAGVCASIANYAQLRVLTSAVAEKEKQDEKKHDDYEARLRALEHKEIN